MWSLSRGKGSRVKLELQEGVSSFAANKSNRTVVPKLEKVSLTACAIVFFCMGNAPFMYHLPKSPHGPYETTTATIPTLQMRQYALED